MATLNNSLSFFKRNIGSLINVCGLKKKYQKRPFDLETPCFRNNVTS